MKKELLRNRFFILAFLLFIGYNAQAERTTDRKVTPFEINQQEGKTIGSSQCIEHPRSCRSSNRIGCSPIRGSKDQSYDRGNEQSSSCR